METEEVVTDTSADVPDTGGDTGGDVATDTPQDAAPVDRPQPSARQSRKQQRIDVEAANRERDEVRRTLETERQERQRLANEMAELRGRMEERQSQTQQQDKQAESRKQVNDLRRQARAQLYFASQAKTKEENDKYWDEADRLNDEANRLVRRMEDEPEWDKRQGAIMSQMPNQQVAQAVAGLDIMFPWVTQNAEARAMADTRLNYLTGHPQHGGAGKGFTRETVLEAMTWTAKAMGLGGHTPPTNGQRQLYGGVPAGEGPGGGGTNSPIPWNRETEALAMAAYRHLEPKQAKAQWMKDMAARRADGKGE